MAWDKARESKTSAQNYLRNVLIESGLGIKDVTDHEIAKVNAWEPTENITTIHLANIFADMVSRRAKIGVSIYRLFIVYRSNISIYLQIVDHPWPYCC